MPNGEARHKRTQIFLVWPRYWTWRAQNTSPGSPSGAPPRFLWGDDSPLEPEDDDPENDALRERLTELFDDSRGMTRRSPMSRRRPLIALWGGTYRRHPNQIIRFNLSALLIKQH